MSIDKRQFMLEERDRAEDAAFRCHGCGYFTDSPYSVAIINEQTGSCPICDLDAAVYGLWDSDALEQGWHTCDEGRCDRPARPNFDSVFCDLHDEDDSP